jgi:hypothetical protein
MDGYKEMLSRIQPETVLCYGKSFDSMGTSINLIEFHYSPADEISHRVIQG